MRAPARVVPLRVPRSSTVAPPDDPAARVTRTWSRLAAREPITIVASPRPIVTSSPSAKRWASPSITRSTTGPRARAGADRAGGVGDAGIVALRERDAGDVEGGAALRGAIEIGDAAQGDLEVALGAGLPRGVVEPRLQPLDRAGGGQHADLGLGVAGERVGVGGAVELADLLQLARDDEHLVHEVAPAAAAERVEREQRLAPPGLVAQIRGLGRPGGEGAEREALLGQGLRVRAEQEDAGGLVGQAGLGVEVHRGGELTAELLRPGLLRAAAVALRLREEPVEEAHGPPCPPSRARRGARLRAEAPRRRY